MKWSDIKENPIIQAIISPFKQVWQAIVVIGAIAITFIGGIALFSKFFGGKTPKDPTVTEDGKDIIVENEEIKNLQYKVDDIAFPKDKDKNKSVEESADDLLNKW